MGDILSEICTKKYAHVLNQKCNISEASLIKKIELIEPPRGFIKNLEKVIKANQFALIAEIKKASPSKGVIREDFDPEELALSYKEGGATCLSILTDGPYFQGADVYLEQARNSVSLPIIRKDFIISSYQILESRAIGADCILLIMACLDDKQAADFKSVADELGMDSLVEVHSNTELDRALKLSPALLGINNRNLKTLEIDLKKTEELAPLVDDDIIIVSESGLHSHEDLLRMHALGISSFLVGESLMRERDVESATKRLLGIEI